MKIAEVETRCECQGRLSAKLDEAGRVLLGTARAGKGERENAPATAMGVGQKLFRIGWLCPLCGRNTLRSFDAAGLVYSEVEAPSPADQA